MDVQIDYAARARKLREAMEARGIDLFLGTRGKTCNYIAGAFVPWRSVLLATRDGFLALHTLILDAERVRHDSWMENVVPCAPLPEAELWEVTVRKIRELGLERARIGVELGHSPRVVAGYLFATEYEYLREQLPEARFENALDLMDELCFVKEPGEIRLMRQAAAIADAAQEAVRESLHIGISELEIAGIAEYEMRKRGSEYHWPVTGSNEVASGYRTWYPMGGCTPPTDKLVQRGESLLVDLHPTYRQYYSDLSHNYLLGKPSAQQRALADAYSSACETLLSALRAGATVGDVFKKVSDELDRSGYRQYTLPGFGHGLGVVGHEWYPAIIDNDEFRDVVLQEDVVEVAALVINVPGVGGMRLECPVRVTPSGGERLSATPLELSVLDL